MTTPKRVWRRRLRWARGCLSARRRAAANLEISRGLSLLADSEGARVVAVYAPLGSEADPTHFAEVHRAAGGTVAYPRVTGSGVMELVCVFDRDQLVPQFKGIYEPRAELPALDLDRLDMVVVPGVGFDRDGRRLGQGMGFYDRLLGAPQLRALRVGIGYAAQIVARVPTEPHDVRLDVVMTERGMAREGRWRAAPRTAWAR